MADTSLDLVIRAQDQASATLKKVEARMKVVNAQTKKNAKAAVAASQMTRTALQKVEAQVVKVSARMKTLGAGITGVGRSLQGMSMAAGLAAGIGIASFAKLDKALTESTAIMSGITDDVRADMKSLAEELSTKVPFAADKIAEGFFFLASAGLDAKQSIAALPAVANFATAGAFDLATATDLLTDAQSALGLTVKDSSKNLENMVNISDILVKANTLANATVSQFSEALTNEAGVAMRQYGIETENGIAVLAAFADQGIKGQKAGSMLGRGIRLLTKAALKNGDEFKKMNIAVFDSQGNFRDMADIAEDMENAFDGMSTQQRSMALEMLGFAARTQQAVLPLIGMSEKIREYDKGLSEAGNTTQEVADKQMKSFSNSMKTTWNSIKVLMGGIMEQLVPVLESIGEKIKAATTRWNNMDDGTKKIIATVILAVAALAPLLIIIGKVTTAIGLLIPVIAAFGAVLTATPIGVAILALGALTVAINQGIKSYEEIRVVSQKELDAMSLNVQLHTQLVERNLKKILRDESEIAAQIEGVSRELVEAKKAGMRDVVAAKEVELRDLLALEKQGALDRLEVLKAEMDATHTKQNELYDQLDELASKKENPILGALFGKQYDKKRKQIKEDLSKLNEQTRALIDSADRIRDIGSSANKMVGDISSPVRELVGGGTPTTTLTETSTETTSVLVDNEDEVQGSYETTERVHKSMSTSVQTGMGNIEKKTKTATDNVHKYLEKLKADLMEIKAITAPKDGKDTRTLDQIFAMTGATSPVSGDIFGAGEMGGIAGAVPLAQTKGGFTDGMKVLSSGGRVNKSAEFHITDDPGNQPIVINVSGNQITDPDLIAKAIADQLARTLRRAKTTGVA